MSKIAYSQFASPWWKRACSETDTTTQAGFWEFLDKEVYRQWELSADDLTAGLQLFPAYVRYVQVFHRSAHYFVAPGVADFCIASVKSLSPDYLRQFPLTARVHCAEFGGSVPGCMFFHFPAKEKRDSVALCSGFPFPTRQGESCVDYMAIAAIASSGALFGLEGSQDGIPRPIEGIISGGDTDAEALRIAPECPKLLFGLSLYMDAFPDAVVPAADGEVHHIKYYKGPRHVVSRSPVMEHEERQARSPHWRRGHFRVLHSPKFVHKRGQTVFIRGTFVRGQAFDILADTPK
jgi:hypothetical protein